MWEARKKNLVGAAQVVGIGAAGPANAPATRECLASKLEIHVRGTAEPRMQLNEIWNPAVGALTARNIVERSSERQPICKLRVNFVVISMVDMFFWVSLQ